MKRFMNTKILFIRVLLTAAILFGATHAPATLIINQSSGPGASNLVIPDGSSVGITSAINISGSGNILGSGDNVSVTLNLAGGNNGDLIAYLYHDNTTVTLLNRPGLTIGNPLGYSDPGFINVILADSSVANSVDAYGGGAVPNGVSFTPSGGNTAFQAFNGQTVDGDWTIFFADLSGGDGSNVSELTGWSLELTTVPEPITLALAIFVGGWLMIGAGRWWRRRRAA